MSGDAWVAAVEGRMRQFALMHSMVLTQTKRQVSAAFEIGCFHALAEFYDLKFGVTPCSLGQEGEYRYLTTPSGDPRNYSYLSLRCSDREFELRQQVRIRSHAHPEIAVTPDLVVIAAGADIETARRPEFASGKRGFYSVSSRDVVAAHECKSMSPFPELLVNFIGILVACHAWFDDGSPAYLVDGEGPHLAPSLFVGGDASALHLKMIQGLEETYPLNVIVGLHSGKWSLLREERQLNRLTHEASA